MEKISKYKAFYFLSKRNKGRLTNCLMLRFLQDNDSTSFIPIWIRSKRILTPTIEAYTRIDK